MWLDGQLDDYMKQDVNNCENGGGKILSYTFAEIIFNSLLIILYYLK